MKVLARLGSAGAKVTAGLGAAVTAGALLATAGGALAAPAGAATHSGFAAGAVFVQTDHLAGNQVVAYDRAGGRPAHPGRHLRHRRARRAAQRLGGRPPGLPGIAGLRPGPRAALRGERGQQHGVGVRGPRRPAAVCGRSSARAARSRSASPSAAAWSTSLNAENGGSVQGYYVAFGRLVPIPGSNRPLGLNPAATPQFTNTPGQVAFSPDGTQLIVTTKDNGNDIDVFGVHPDGRLSRQPVVNPEPGTVPFAITFDPAGHLVIADAGTNALSTFALGPDGTVTLLDAVGTGQSATCWVAPDGSLLFASNAGSATISGYSSGAGGALTLLGQTPTDPGTVDAAVTPGGHFVYVQTGGNGVVDEFAVGPGGSLAEVGHVTVAGAVGGEGIVAA